MTTPTKQQLSSQLARMRHSRLLDRIANAADANDLPVAYVVAIASREDWKLPTQPVIDAEVKILASHFHAVRDAEGLGLKKGSLGPALKIAAAGYNCGIDDAINAAMAGDCDKHTTGRDYSRDVMDRYAVFQELMK